MSWDSLPPLCVPKNKFYHLNPTPCRALKPKLKRVIVRTLSGSSISIISVNSHLLLYTDLTNTMYPSSISILLRKKKMNCIQYFYLKGVVGRWIPSQTDFVTGLLCFVFVFKF